MTTKKNDSSLFWIGYSWFLGPTQSMLTVSYVQNEGAKKSKIKAVDSKPESKTFKWPSKIEASAPPDPGIVSTLGIAGIGGYLLDAQTKLSPQELLWREQVKCLEDRFERMLADALMATIHRIIEEHPKARIVIQGPAFPKLLGRLSYRNMRDGDLDILFMTFRRRFLTPSPLLRHEVLSDKSLGYLYGPIPSFHEEAYTRKYYLLPAMSENQLSFPIASGHYCPLLIELFEQNVTSSREADLQRLEELLEGLGVNISSDNRIVINKDSALWSIYPNQEAFQRVLTPKELLQAHRHSVVKLRELADQDVNSNENFDNLIRFLDVADEKAKQIDNNDLAKAARGYIAKAKDKVLEIKTEGWMQM